MQMTKEEPSRKATACPGHKRVHMQLANTSSPLSPFLAYMGKCKSFLAQVVYIYLSLVSMHISGIVCNHQQEIGTRRCCLGHTASTSWQRSVPILMSMPFVKTIMHELGSYRKQRALWKKGLGHSDQKPEESLDTSVFCNSSLLRR